jgi:hypothetical protein
MADITLTTAGRVEVVQSIIQATLPAAETITAGEAVRIDTNGKFTGANGTTTTENRIYGIATRAAIAGEAVTAIRKGVIDGLAITGMAYDAIVYLSDTDGALGTTAGTVSTIVGRVIPGWAQPVGTAADKLLFVDL